MTTRADQPARRAPLSRDLVLETAKLALANTAGDGVRYGPCGMLGGEDGVPHDYRLISAGRAPRLPA